MDGFSHLYFFARKSHFLGVRRTESAPQAFLSVSTEGALKQRSAVAFFS